MGWDWRSGGDWTGSFAGKAGATGVDGKEPSPGDARASSCTNAHWPGSWSGTSLLTFPRPVALLADDKPLPIGRRLKIMPCPNAALLMALTMLSPMPCHALAHALPCLVLQQIDG